MFENRHRVHFLTLYLNASVFSSLSQTQFSVLYGRLFPGSIAIAQQLACFSAMANSCRLQIDLGQNLSFHRRYH